MKPTSWLVNTSRGPIVDETALIEALKGKQLADAALDVLDIEPLPKNDPFRTLGTVMATPHLGYVSRQQYETWYGDTAAGVSEWLDAHAPAAPTTPTILVAE
jgi:phosphoglycerate dehydrogenase-like enzyme